MEYKPDLEIKYGPHDWPEDASHENGDYTNDCIECKTTFLGNKRRHVCRKCAEAASDLWDNLTDAEREERAIKTNRHIEEFFKNYNDQIN